MKSRLNCYFDAKLADQLTAFALRQGVHRSQLVEAAVTSFLSPDALDRREAAFVRRLDRLSRQMDRIERDLTIAIEVHALFVRFWLSASPPIPPAQQDAAKAQGASRYQGFIETLARRLQRGGSLIAEISREIMPEHYRSAGAATGADDDTGADLAPAEAQMAGTEDDHAEP